MLNPPSPWRWSCPKLHDKGALRRERRLWLLTPCTFFSCHARTIPTVTLECHANTLEFLWSFSEVLLESRRGRRNLAMKSEGVIHFAAFRLDCTNEQLCRGSQLLPLRPKPFAILHYLATHPNQLVIKEELLKAVTTGFAAPEVKAAYTR